MNELKLALVPSARDFYDLLRPLLPQGLNAPLEPPEVPSGFKPSRALMLRVYQLVFALWHDHVGEVYYRALLQSYVLASLYDYHATVLNSDLERAADSFLLRWIQAAQLPHIASGLHDPSATRDLDAFCLYRTNGAVRITTPTGYLTHVTYNDYVRNLTVEAARSKDTIGWPTPAPDAENTVVLIQFFAPFRRNDMLYVRRIHTFVQMFLYFHSPSPAASMNEEKATIDKAVEVVLDFSGLADLFAHQRHKTFVQQTLAAWLDATVKITREDCRTVVILPQGTHRSMAVELTKDCNFTITNELKPDHTLVAVSVGDEVSKRERGFAYQIAGPIDRSRSIEPQFLDQVDNNGAFLVLCDITLKKAMLVSDLLQEKKSVNAADKEAMRAPPAYFFLQQNRFGLERRRVWVYFVDLIKIMTKYEDWIDPAKFLVHYGNGLTEAQRSVPVLVIGTARIREMCEALNRHIEMNLPRQPPELAYDARIQSIEAPLEPFIVLQDWDTRKLVNFSLGEPFSSSTRLGRLDDNDPRQRRLLPEHGPRTALLIAEYDAIFGAKYDAMCAMLVTRKTDMHDMKAGAIPWYVRDRMAEVVFKGVSSVTKAIKDTLNNLLASDDVASQDNMLGRMRVLLLTMEPVLAREAVVKFLADGAKRLRKSVRLDKDDSNSVDDFLRSMVTFYAKAMLSDPPVTFDADREGPVIDGDYVSENPPADQEVFKFYPAMYQRFYFTDDLLVLRRGMSVFVRK